MDIELRVTYEMNLKAFSLKVQPFSQGRTTVPLAYARGS
jgi:hypothetical protein